MSVVTRFAPSPTGMLHIGGARTALINWVFAKQHHGQFRIRIEDTDTQRSTEEAVDAIVTGLRWLRILDSGVAVDGFVRQRARLGAHQAAVAQLLEAGLAYRCYMSQEELARERKANQNFRYDGRWRDRPQSEAPKDVKPVIRLKRDLSQDVQFTDRVQGDISVQARELDDFVLLRADGTPTYMLAVVVDDHAMQVTTVIRGADHISNTARQIQLYQALGYPVPEFAHIPLLHDSSGAKLSKRTGTVGVQAYTQDGFLPEALCNYLLYIGGGCGEDAEIFTLKHALTLFSLDRLNHAAARFDSDKLRAINYAHIQSLALDDLAVRLAPFMPAVALEPAHQNRWRAGLEGLRARASTLVELVQQAQFYWKAPTYPLTDPQALQALSPDVRPVLEASAAQLASCQEWTHEVLKAALRDLGAQHHWKFGQIARPVRAAVCGNMHSPDLIDCLVSLGRGEVLARLERASANV